jgi:hypothetical protein
MMRSLHHLNLWNCPAAQDVWSCGPKKIQKCFYVGSTFLQIVESLMKQCKVEDIELAVMVAHKLWFRRKKVVHVGELLHPNKLLTEACNSLNEFRRVNYKEHDADTPINWKKPLTCMFKVNLDAAVDKTQGRNVIGIVVQDHEGVVMVACSLQKALFADVAVVEELAAIHVVKLCREMSFFDIILKGNALQVVKAVNMGSPN